MVADDAGRLARVRHLFGVEPALIFRFTRRVVLVRFARRVVQALLLAGFLVCRHQRLAAGVIGPIAGRALPVLDARRRRVVDAARAGRVGRRAGRVGAKPQRRRDRRRRRRRRHRRRRGRRRRRRRAAAGSVAGSAAAATAAAAWAAAPRATAPRAAGRLGGPSAYWRECGGCSAAHSAFAGSMNRWRCRPAGAAGPPRQASDGAAPCFTPVADLSSRANRRGGLSES